jgi:dTDP-glucose 4,6-dehydratase
MRLLVTGGAGFIGSNFVHLAASGNFPLISSITVIDNLTYAGNLKNLENLPLSDFEFIRGDICNQELTGKLASRTDAIINFAAESHVDRSISESKKFVETNVLGVQTLLEVARLKSVKTFLQVSTDEVYGSIDQGSWSESHPLLPNSPYAATKAAADLLARSYFRTYGLDVRVTRSSNNYGPRQFPEKFIPLMVTRLMKNLKVPIYGNGQNTRDWIHVEDHCRALYLVLTSGQAGEIYNIGGGKELKNIDLAKMLIVLTGKDDSSIEYVSDRLGHDLRYSVDSEKISRELGFEPLIEFNSGLESTLRWYMENQSWWQ